MISRPSRLDSRKNDKVINHGKLTCVTTYYASKYEYPYRNHMPIFILRRFEGFY